MDINSLRVFNAMYNLGLYDEEINHIEKETKQPHTGIANMYTTKKNYLVYVDHDNKNEILIKKFSNSKVAVPSRILCKTMITFDPLPEEVYTLHTIARYRAHDWEYKYEAKNLEELKLRIIDRFADDWDKDIKNEKQMNALYWLFDQEPDHKHFETYKVRKNLKTIVKVFSVKNRRLAIIKEHAEWTGGSYMFGGCRELKEEVTFTVKSFKPSDPEYNYVAPGREFKGSLWIDDDLVGKLSYPEIKLIMQRKGCEYHDRESFYLLTSKEYANLQNSLRVELMTKKREAQEEEVKERFTNEAEKQYNKNKSYTRDGVTFKPKEISYGDLKLKGPRIDEFIRFNNLITADNSDFNSIMTTYVDYVCEAREWGGMYSDSRTRYDLEFKGKVNLTIGKIKVEIEGKETKSKNSYIYYVNGNRIRKDEFTEVIKRAIGYDSEEQYNEFVERVSKISLRLDKVLRNGLNLILSISPRNDNDIIKNPSDTAYNLKVIREDNKNYLVIKKKKYKITNLSEFLSLPDMPDQIYDRTGHVNRFIRILSKSTEMDPEEIGRLIKSGKKEYNLKVKRSKEFIKQAASLTKAKRNKEGYVVKGTSGKEYWIGDDLSVYTWDKGDKNKYLCIVDMDSDTKSQAGRNDCVAKRILALSKDSVVAKEIYDKGDHVDSYWKELMAS